MFSIQKTLSFSRMNQHDKNQEIDGLISKISFSIELLSKYFSLTQTNSLSKTHIDTSALLLEEIKSEQNFLIKYRRLLELNDGIESILI